jgi:hypothetical protein
MKCHVLLNIFYCIALSIRLYHLIPCLRTKDIPTIQFQDITLLTKYLWKVSPPSLISIFPAHFEREYVDPIVLTVVWLERGFGVNSSSTLLIRAWI